MGYIKTDEVHYQNIANEIRRFTGLDEMFKPSEMPDRISDVYITGGDDGFYTGYSYGYEDATYECDEALSEVNNQLANITSGVAEGGKSYYDFFWDTFQDYGKRTTYRYAFGGWGWTPSIFKPKYKIVLPSESWASLGAFAIFGNSSEPPLDYRTVKDMIVTSALTSAQDLFNSARMNYIDVDLSNCTTLWACFQGSWQKTGLTHLTLKVSEKCTDYDYAFGYNNELTNLTFKDGSVIAANISFPDAPLNRASFESVISALSPSVSGKTVSFKKSAKEAAFTDSEWNALISTKTNWTIELA